MDSKVSVSQRIAGSGLRCVQMLALLATYCLLLDIIEAQDSSLPPIITMPSMEDVILAPSVPIEVMVGERPADIGPVKRVAVFAGGTLIGFASPTRFFGDWHYPSLGYGFSADVLIEETANGGVQIEMDPDPEAPAYRLNGIMMAADRFSGTFHRPAWGDTEEVAGSCSLRFSFPQRSGVAINDDDVGLLTVEIEADEPLGSRVLSGGLGSNQTYRFVWNKVLAGEYSLSAVTVHQSIPLGLEWQYPTEAVDIVVLLPPTIAHVSGQSVLTWDGGGILQVSSDGLHDWQDVPGEGVTSPYLTPTGGMPRRFFRLRLPEVPSASP